MSRGQEIIVGIVVIIGGIIAYPWIVENVWNDWLADSVAEAMPYHGWTEAWGDLFMAGVPIGLLIVIIAFGLLLILGKVPGGKRRDDTER